MCTRHPPCAARAAIPLRGWINIPPAPRALNSAARADGAVGVWGHGEALAAGWAGWGDLAVADEGDELFAGGAADGAFGEGLAALGAGDGAIGVGSLILKELWAGLDELGAGAWGDADEVAGAVLP